MTGILRDILDIVYSLHGHLLANIDFESLHSSLITVTTVRSQYLDNTATFVSVCSLIIRHTRLAA